MEEKVQEGQELYKSGPLLVFLLYFLFFGQILIVLDISCAVFGRFETWYSYLQWALFFISSLLSPGGTAFSFFLFPPSAISPNA